MNSNKKSKEIKERFETFFKGRSEAQAIRHDEYMLMAAFLSEIERIQKQKDIKRNRLAQLIKTSASYLTQVFRGDKPLNFHTIAKMQRSLNIRFSIQAHYKSELVNNVFNNISSDEVNLSKYAHILWQSKYNFIDFEKNAALVLPSASYGTAPVLNPTIIN